MIRPLHATLPLFVLLPGACAGDGLTYPSLAPRAVEKVELTEPATQPPSAPAADPALDAEVAAAVKARLAAAASFDTAAARIERQVRAARGATPGSTAWLDAQVALAGLDEARGAHDSRVAAIEELAATRASTGAPPYPALEQALDAGRAEATRETRRTDAIASMLPAG